MAEKDTFVAGWAPIVQNDQHGLDRYMYVGTQRYNTGPDSMRSLIEFDLSAIPSAINGAELELTIAGFGDGTPTSVHYLAINAVTGSWVEGRGARPCDAALPADCQDVDVAPGVDWSNQPAFDATPVTYFEIDRAQSMVGDAVRVDIKPGSDPNCFNVNGSGVIPVAILGSETFNAGQINLDPNSDNALSFNGLSVRVRGKKGPLCGLEFANEDDYLDLVCHFEDDVSQWIEGGDRGVVNGELFDGTLFTGSDAICVRP